jgi:hypothetical protein
MFTNETRFSSESSAIAYHASPWPFSKSQNLIQTSHLSNSGRLLDTIEINRLWCWIVACLFWNFMKQIVDASNLSTVSIFTIFPCCVSSCFIIKSSCSNSDRRITLENQNLEIFPALWHTRVRFGLWVPSDVWKVDNLFQQLLSHTSLGNLRWKSALLHMASLPYWHSTFQDDSHKIKNINHVYPVAEFSKLLSRGKRVKRPGLVPPGDYEMTIYFSYRIRLAGDG